MPDLALASTWLANLREEARALKVESEKLQREAQELNLRAGEKYEAFIQFDLLADKFEQAIEDATGKIEPLKTEAGE